MKNKKIFLNLSIVSLLIISIFAFQACDKDENSIEAIIDLNVSLKAANSSKSDIYDSINLDIRKISIHTSSDSGATSGWFDLATNVGIYNLLDFVNNDTIIAFDSLFELRTVSQIRLLLGDQNTIIEDGISYDLVTPSGQTSGIKVQVHTQFLPGETYKINLDFDPEKSINKTGNGTYKLKPVIKTSVIQQ